MADRLRAVRGKLPRRHDIAQWNEDRLCQFLELVCAFTEGESVVIRPETLLAQEQRALSGRFPFLEEIFARIGQLTADPDATPRKFYARLMNVVRNVGEYVKLNPSVATERVRAIAGPNPRLSWMLRHYAKQETAVGAEVIVPDNRDRSERSVTRRAENPEDPQVRLAEAMLTLSDVMAKLVGSVDSRELKRMSSDKKVALALRIYDTLSRGRGVKSIGTFKQIVINRASRDDLEAAMLDVNGTGQ